MQIQLHQYRVAFVQQFKFFAGARPRSGKTQRLQKYGFLTVDRWGAHLAGCRECPELQAVVASKFDGTLKIVAAGIAADLGRAETE